MFKIVIRTAAQNSYLCFITLNLLQSLDQKLWFPTGSDTLMIHYDFEGAIREMSLHDVILCVYRQCMNRSRSNMYRFICASSNCDVENIKAHVDKDKIMPDSS